MSRNFENLAKQTNINYADIGQYVFKMQLNLPSRVLNIFV